MLLYPDSLLLFVFLLNLCEVPHADLMLLCEGDQVWGAQLRVGGGNQGHTQNRRTMGKDGEEDQRGQLDNIDVAIVVAAAKEIIVHVE